MEIRRLTPAHAPEYRALMLEAYAAHPDAFTSTVAERAALPLSWWEERLCPGPRPAQLVLGAFGPALLGVVGLAFATRERTRHKATLFGLYVPASHRGLGLGHRLVAAALDEARARPGLKVIQLTVTEANAGARELYERHGFVPFGLEPLAVSVGSGFLAKVHMGCTLG